MHYSFLQKIELRHTISKTKINELLVIYMYIEAFKKYCFTVLQILKMIFYLDF